jgi:hypothetical protein
MRSMRSMREPVFLYVSSSELNALRVTSQMRKTTKIVKVTSFFLSFYCPNTAFYLLKSR